MKKRVLVTGSSRGIGSSVARKLAAQGFAVTLHGKTESDALLSMHDELCSQYPETQKLVFDVLQREQVKQLLLEDIASKGAFYGIVLSAGLHRDMPFPAMEDDAWDEVLGVSLDGFYNVLRPLVMPMIQLRDGGRIVPIASLSGVIGNRGQVNYSAAKAGLIGAAKALARELAKRRISVNCIAPGAIATDMVSAEVEEQLLKHIPMSRLGRPEEVAAAVSYLFSSEAEYMTGQTLVLSGGLF